MMNPIVYLLLFVPMDLFFHSDGERLNECVDGGVGSLMNVFECLLREVNRPLC